MDLRGELVSAMNLYVFIKKQKKLFLPQTAYISEFLIAVTTSFPLNTINVYSPPELRAILQHGGKCTKIFLQNIIHRD